jgi:hypothetical protein
MCAGMLPPYPLAVISSGFLTSASSYLSYARRLASWGYTVVMYDKGQDILVLLRFLFSDSPVALCMLETPKLELTAGWVPAVESATEPLDDRLCVELIREIIDWARIDPIVSQLADTDTTYLCGHSRVRPSQQNPLPCPPLEALMTCALRPALWCCLSSTPSFSAEERRDACPIGRQAWSSGALISALCCQGGKVSALAAVVDPRVKAVCLLDPVDVTVYTPQGPDFPSAVAAVRHMSRGIPLAVIGSGRAGDCVPKDSNYR